MANTVVRSRRVARGLCRTGVLAALVAVIFVAIGTPLFGQHSNTGAASLGLTVSPEDLLTIPGGTSVSLKIRLGTGPAYLWGDSLSDCGSAPTIGNPTNITASGTYTPLLTAVPFNTTSNDYVCVYDPGTLSLNTSVAWPHTGLKLVFNQSSIPNTAAGSSITPAVTVQVQDSNGILVASSTASVALAITSGTPATGGPGTLSGTLTKSAVNGVATFSNLSIDKDGNAYTLTATSSGISNGTSGTFNITSGGVSASKSTVVASPTSVTADGTTTSMITVTLLDTNSNPVSGKTVTLAAGSGSSTITTVNGTTNSSGQATFTVKDTVAQAVTYTATDTTDSNLVITQTATVTFMAGTATKLAFTTQPGGGTGGAAWSQQPAVTVEDAFGNAVTSSSASIKLAQSSGTFTCTINPLAASSGVATFAGCEMNQAGSGYTLTATSGGLTSATSSAFAITVGTAIQLAFTTEPVGGIYSGAFPTQPVVTVEDAGGNKVTTSTAPITLAIGTNPSGGTLSGCSSNPLGATGGTATFSGCKISNVTSGTGFTLTAASSGLSTATSTPFDITTGAGLSAPTVGAQSPNSVPKGGSSTYSISVSTSPTSACTASLTLTGTALPTGASGSFSPSQLVFDATSPLTSTLTITTSSTTPAGTTSGVTVTATGSNGCTGTYPSSAFSLVVSAAVNPASATNSTVSASPASVAANGSTTSTITVTLKDGSNNLLSGKTVTLSAGSGSSTISAASGPSNSGVVTFTVKDATAEAVTYTATDTTDTITVTQKPIVTFTASKLAFITAPISTTAGTCSSQIIVQTLDGSNNPTDPPSTATVALSSSSTGGTFYSNSGCTTPISGNTVSIGTGASSASFWYQDTKAGSPVITAAATGGVTSSPTQTETVNVGTAAKLAFIQQPSTTTAGSAISPAVTVQVQDASGNVVATDSSTVAIAISSGGNLTGTTSVAAVNGVATFSNLIPTAAGSFTLSATDGSLTGATSNSFTVNQASQTITVTMAAPSSAVYGQQFTVAATASSGLSVTYSSAGGCSNSGATFTMTSGTTACTVKFDQAGNSTYGAATEVTETVTAQKATLTVTGITANSKVYDGTTTSTLNTGGAALAGVVSGDSGNVTLNTASAVGTFSDRNVGTSKTVTISGLTISGTKAGNYTLTQPTTTANITAKALTITGLTASAKVYDGTTAEPLGGTAALLAAEASGAGTTSDGKPYSVDSVSAGGTATGTFANKNVGTSLAVTVTGVTITGTGSGNYTATQQTGLTANITTRAITVTAATNTKTYNGTTSAAATPTITTGSLASGDSATWTETYDNKNAGTGKTMTPAGSVSDGNSGNNYTVTFATSTNGTINKLAITVTAASNTKTYDGTTSAAATPTITSGALQGTDTANFTEAYSTATVGTGKTLIPSGTVTDGNSGNNYSYTFVNNTTGVITAGAAAKLAFTTQPGGTSYAGAALGTQPVVTVQDAGGNTVTTDNTDVVTLAIGTNPGGGTLTCTPVQVTSGVATFAGCQISLGGTGYTLKATSGSLTSATSSAFNIQDFSLSASPTSGTVTRPSSFTYSPGITLASLGGFQGSVTPACQSVSPTTGTPITCSQVSFFYGSINWAIPTTTMTVTTTNGPPATTPGTYTITIKGTYSGIPVRTVQVTLTVQ